MPDTVRETFDELREALKRVINHLLAHPDSGHYAVALHVAIGSEALSRLQGHRKDTLFVELMTKHGFPQDMARDLFEALRHGIAHTYDTRFIQAGPLKIELIVSWRQKKHLSVRRQPPGLVLNVRTMWEDLSEAIARLNAELPSGGKLPPAWVKGSIQPGNPRANTAWREWIATREAME